MPPRKGDYVISNRKRGYNNNISGGVWDIKSNKKGVVTLLDAYGGTKTVPENILRRGHPKKYSTKKWKTQFWEFDE